MKEYTGYFDDWADVKAQFSNHSDWKDDGLCGTDIEPQEEPEHVFADYNQECYEGDATVAFYTNGKFYVAEGSHCSCYGLEGQWEPTDYEPEVFRAMVDRLEQGEYSYGLAKHKKKLEELYNAVMEPKLL